MLTFGHGRLDTGALSELLTGAGITTVVDVRRFPGSRSNAAASRGAIPDIVTALGRHPGRFAPLADSGLPFG